MNIYVLDGLNGISDVIEVYESVIWNVQYFWKGDFQLKVPGSQKNINNLVPGVLMVLEQDVLSDGYRHVMKIENRDIDFDVERGWMLTLTGSGLKNIVGQRIIWDQTNLNGLVESGIRHVITQNIINPADTNRKINDFILGDVQGFDDVFDTQLLGENIADWLTTICQKYGIGWDVVIKNNKYVFTLTKGTDRTYDQDDVMPVIFSPEYDNLASSTYRYTGSEYANAALVGGEGEGVDKVIAHVGTSSGLGRFETYLDGSNVSSDGEIITPETYTLMLENYGNEQLVNKASQVNVSGTIISDGMYKLNEDYFLGDMVQILNNGISAKSRITEIIYSEDDNGARLVPTFSDWEG